MLLLPAGTGHKNDGSSADLLVIGAYAGGWEWGLCRPEETDVEEARETIAWVLRWGREPIGREG